MVITIPGSNTRVTVDGSFPHIIRAESNNFDTTGYVLAGNDFRDLSYHASYSGDTVYKTDALSGAECENLRVNKLPPTVVTKVILIDVATVTGGGATPTGNVKFTLYDALGCTGNVLTTETVALSTGSAESNRSVAIDADAARSYEVDYAGDSVYKAAGVFGTNDDGHCEDITVDLDTN